MKLIELFKQSVALATLVIAASYATVALAADNVATMAGIVLSLQHFPSDADKAALAAIVEGDASEAEKTVARAIAGIQHKVSAADKAALDAIAADEAQGDGIRTLAAVVAGLNHVPGADAKAALAELAGH